MIDTAAPRNVHAIPPPPGDDHFVEVDTMVLPKLRAVTNDPLREYAARPGAVEPLPDSVASLILCKKGWAKIERHQIKVTLDGEDLFFASRDSIVIAAKNGTGERVLWALNRRAPHTLHLLTADGRYIESVPRKGEAQWFSQDEASAAAIGDAKAMLARDMARVAALHAPAAAQAKADAQHNAAEVRRLVQTFPVAPQDSDRLSRKPADTEADRIIAPAGDGNSFDRAAEITAAMRSAEHQRERHVARREHARQSAGSLDDIEPDEPRRLAPAYEEQAGLDAI